MLPEDVWFGIKPAERAARAVLAPLSWIYALGWRTYEGLYASGLKKPKEPQKPVVCVGSLTVGGSGKTPLALRVIEILKKRSQSGDPDASGHSKVVLSCSGYGSPASESAKVAPPGALVAKRWGDEPAMARWLNPELPIIVGRDRVRAAEICDEQFPNAILILDDGFQHLPLKKHISIVIDSSSLNRMCLPAGPYREPRSGLERAQMVVMEERGRRESGFWLESRSEFLISPLGIDVAIQKGAHVGLLCAVARPKRIKNSIEKMGLEIQFEKLLTDHDPLTAGNLCEGFPKDVPIVVTAKDWVKLRDRPDVQDRTFWIARHHVVVQPAEAFQIWLEQALMDAAP